jgi:hypothetical protein
MSSLLASSNDPIKPRATIGAICPTASRSVWTSVPLPHAKVPIVSSRYSSNSSVVTPASAIATAEPARINRVGPDAPPADRLSTSTAAASPPRKAIPPAGNTGSGIPKAATTTTAR